ncbi:MAG: hypothetical protein ACRC46_07475 [Thermoguttaceae bacterium]
MINPIRFSVCCVLLAVVTLFGCGSGTKVSGKVTFSDGKPLTVGRVVFTNGTLSASGGINKNGEFRMGMSKDGDGVPEGSYKVYITEARVPGDHSLAQKDEDGVTFTPFVDAIDPKFASADRSGLTCEVKGTTKYDITVEPPGKDYKPLPDTSDRPKSGKGD